MRKYENLFFLVLAVIGAAIFTGSRNITALIQEPVTASSYGMLVSGAFTLTCIIRIIQNVIAAKNGKEDGKLVIAYPVIIIGMCVMIFVYAFGITAIGYFTSTFVFMWAMLVLLGGTKELKAIVKYGAFSIVFCVVLYFMFKVMSVYLPNTPLI